MIRRFIDYFSHNKYRLTMFALLAGATIFSVIVWRVRYEYQRLRELFLFDLEPVPRVDSVHHFVFHLYRQTHTPTKLYCHPVCGFFLADLLPQRTLYSDGSAASRR